MTKTRSKSGTGRFLAALALLVMLLGCDTPTGADTGGGDSGDDSGSSSAPPPAIVAIDPEPEPINWESDIKIYTYQLEPDGSADGTLYYRTREEDLPPWIVLDEATGVVTVDSGKVELGYDESVTQQLSFYSSYNASKGDDADGGSTWDEPLEQTFEIYRTAI